VLDHGGVEVEGSVVTAKVGGRFVRRDLRTAYSYLAANSPLVHFGLGTEARIDEVEVRWIDGTTEGFGSFDAGGTVTLRRGGGEKKGRR